MSYYYVTHPNIDFSATVKAPSTDKARTAFLDYLERTGKASRKYRQDIRRNTVAERIEFPEEVDTDVKLYYNYTDGDDEETMSVGYIPEKDDLDDVREDLELDDSIEKVVDDTLSDIESEPLPVEQAEKDFDIKDTPIGRMSLGSV